METGVAYISNRLLSHIREDMKNIVEHNCTYVLHTYTENDMVRHSEVMPDIVKITHDFGLKVWMDSWGIGKIFAGDISLFSGEYPEARAVLSDGTPLNRACLYAPEFRAYIKKWADMAASTGADAFFWDEPNLPFMDATEDKPALFGCRCPRCQKLFHDMFGHEMPTEMDDEVIDFRHKSVIDFLDFATSYGHEKGLENVVCCMIANDARYGDKNWQDIVSLPHVDNFGTDPYCHGNKNIDLIKYTQDNTRKVVELGKKFKKGHHIWVQAFNITAGCEGEIVQATLAARDAGAENIAAWGFMGCEGNNYRCDNPDMAWQAVGDAFRKIRWNI